MNASKIKGMDAVGNNTKAAADQRQEMHTVCMHVEAINIGFICNGHCACSIPNDRTSRFGLYRSFRDENFVKLLM
jgi:hypothetical protein